MILLIDNYDSFAYNLYQLLGAVEPDIRVMRNDAVTLDQIEEMRPEALVLSPGPGHPADAGICIEAVRHFSGKIPILGVCLGHQAICEAFGGTVSYAKELMHGKARQIRVVEQTPIYEGMGDSFLAARYHSLSLVRETLPECLKINALCDDGEVMGVEHREFPVYGLQFHPESVLTPDGNILAKNFIRICREYESPWKAQ